MQSCPRCGKENPVDALFCSRCGLDMAEYRSHQSKITETESNFCSKHPKRSTNLSCGRCGKPFCTDCLALGPAGPRCRECGKQNISFRPTAVLHAGKQRLASISRLGPWGIYAIIMIALMVFGAMRSCAGFLKQTNEPPESMRRLDEAESLDQ